MKEKFHTVDDATFKVLKRIIKEYLRDGECVAETLTRLLDERIALLTAIKPWLAVTRHGKTFDSVSDWLASEPQPEPAKEE